MATARDLGAEEGQAYLQAARARLVSHVVGSLDDARRQRLLSAARAAAEVLRHTYGATPVVLFGSLAHQECLHAGSDVDLAVEGVEAGRYRHAWAAVESLFGSVPVDLVDLADAAPSLQREIELYGMEL